VTHTIQPGETLSILSKRYYGDINHYDLIARFNGLEDPTNIQLGQQIKIPQVEGLPFMEEEAQPQGAPVQTPAAMKSALPETPAAVKGPVPQTPAPTVGTPSEKVEPAVAKENRPSLDEEVAGYREQGIEFYNDKNYADAINEFEKVLSARPADQAAGKYMALSYYELGTQSYQKQDYAQAIQKSKKALEYDPGCANCQALVKKSEESFKDIHYRKGLDYFTNEKLADAIREWQLVYDMDPHYEDVDRNLQKARLLQERLDAIRRSKQSAQ
jgi:tetratricopeptide (TPR) repeat protein